MSPARSPRARRLPWRDLRLGLVAVAVGILVGATPMGTDWEEELGLTWLFRLRGPVPAPRDVVVVTIDQESSDRLGLPEKPRKWPRDLHGRLVERLAQAGASVIVFDVIFQEPRVAAEDRAFADAVRRAGNVVLFEFLRREFPSLGAGDRVGLDQPILEQRVPPIAVLADAALASAPFALPRTPIKVSQVWLFKPEAGDAPTLPILALRVHARRAHERLLSLIEAMDPSTRARIFRAGDLAGEESPVSREVRALRALFRSDPSLASRLRERLQATAGAGTQGHDRMAALLFAYSGSDSLHLNFYGPPRSIATIPYHRILDAPPDELDLAGRAVFVGSAARLQPDQKDGFYTTYTQDTGLDVSGVEIAATTFANLLERHPIRPLAPGLELLLLAAWGLLAALAVRRPAGGWIPLAALAVGGAYFAGALIAFVRFELWMPLVTPLLVQLPVATFGGILLRFRDIQRERENIRRAFGMRLPNVAVDQLARGIDDFTASTEHAFGICLATDAEKFTALAERLEPAMLKELMNDYYRALFAPVKARGGVVADVVGDSMLAIWATGMAELELRQSACRSALEILEAVDAFNARNPRHRLPTRLGLHCGELVLGYVGADDHFEYRAVGDIVNTASRIEGLSKHLGTRLLVSADVAQGLGDLALRELGRFLLKGKTRPVAICELMGVQGRIGPALVGTAALFAEGLEAFGARGWQEAIGCFEAIERQYGRDGPSRFYLDLCRRFLYEPPEKDWNGIIALGSK